MIVRSYILCLALLLNYFTVLGQAGSSSVLDAYIREGLDNNLALKQERLQVSAAVQSLRQARALFYPQFTLAPTYSVAMGGRRLAFPVGDMLNPAYAALNELTGSNQFPTNIQNVNELLAPNNFHDTKISFQYSIYNPEIKYNYLIQQSLLSGEEARVRVVTDELRFAIAEAYFKYLQALSVRQIFDTGRGTLQELVRLNSKWVDNNVKTRDAVLSSEYELSALDKQLLDADRDVRIAASYFNFLLNKELDSEVLADSTLNTIVQAEDFALSDLIAGSLNTRPELKQLASSLTAAEQAVKLHEKSAALPSFFLGGNTGFQGFGYRFTNQGYAIAQVGLQWDLFKGFERKAKIGQAQIQADILRTKQTEAGRQITLEVTQSYYAAKAASDGVRVANAGLQMAESLFKIVDSRYRNQQVLMVEYLKARSDLQTAKIQQALARYELLTRIAHLERVSGKDY